MNELEFLKKENEELKKEIEYYKNFTKIKKISMNSKSKEGLIMNRPPFGYKLELGILIPNEDAKKVEDLFLEFRDSNLSLRSISKKYGFSVPGIKKILTNFTYLGKIKFNKEVYEGKHKPIISSILFNQVQDKLEKINA